MNSIAQVIPSRKSLTELVASQYGDYKKQTLKYFLLLHIQRLYWKETVNFKYKVRSSSSPSMTKKLQHSKRIHTHTHTHGGFNTELSTTACAS